VEKTEDWNTAQHKKDKDAFAAWKKKNSIARITFLCSIENDVMRELRRFKNVKDMWAALVARFGQHLWPNWDSSQW